MGCRPQASVVFRDSTFQDNPDLRDPRYRYIDLVTSLYLNTGLFWSFPYTLQFLPGSSPDHCSTELGMYQPHCGLENVLMSWGHDGEDS